MGWGGGWGETVLRVSAPVWGWGVRTLGKVCTFPQDPNSARHHGSASTEVHTPKAASTEVPTPKGGGGCALFTYKVHLSEVSDISSMGHFVDLGQENTSVYAPSPETYFEKHRPPMASGGAARRRGGATNPSRPADPGRHTTPATRPHAQE